MSSLALSGLAVADQGGKFCKKHGKFSGANSSEFMEKRMTRMSEKLGLSDDQQQQLKAVMESKATTRTSLQERKQAIREEMKNLDPTAAAYESDLRKIAAKKAALVEESTIARGMSRQQFAGILTEEQRAKMKEMRANKGKRWGKGGFGGHRGGHHNGGFF